ncbi:MAG: alpha/beta hydrolase fold domain-containing protein, partial [Ferruginibacter sp.]
NDVKAAIRWVKANAAKYKFSQKRIALWGGSAGGNLAALAGTSGDVKELGDMNMGNANESSRVMAEVDWFGPTNFL